MNRKKKTIASIAPAGIVTTQDRNILPTTRRSMASTPRARPTPRTAPTSVCVVEIGIPVPDATTIWLFRERLVKAGAIRQLFARFDRVIPERERIPWLGSRIAEVHNGSSLFTGDAGQGESNIRRWIIENDWLEAIVALPLNMFYNTGIATYVWVLTNRQPEHRRGKVQLIDATKWSKPLRKNLGKKNCELSEEDIARICEVFLAIEETEESKIFDNEDFVHRVLPFGYKLPNILFHRAIFQQKRPGRRVPVPALLAVAATAAGLVGFAIGSETWGSIVSPSTRCGASTARTRRRPAASWPSSSPLASVRPCAACGSTCRAA